MKAMKSSSTLFLTLLAVQLPCRALEEKSIVAAGDWSQPVAGTVDPQTGRGAHRPLIRGRLLLCESAKNQQTAIYFELQDSGDSWGGTKEIHFDPGGCQLEMRDPEGQLIPPKPSAFSGGVPAALWMSLPCDSTLRMRISPYASFSHDSGED